MTAAGLMAWDLCGGVIGYNHIAIKIRSIKEHNVLPPLHHNFQHIHPLMLMFFNNDYWLLSVTLYWFLSFILYVEFLEINPSNGRRKFGERGQKLVIVFEISVAIFLMMISFFVTDIPADYQIFGMTVYAFLIVSTITLINIPLSFQRTIAIIEVVGIVFLGMLLSPPAGFQWLIPVYFLKLLVGFTAKEELKVTKLPYT